jgi:hypothetical protein
MSQRITNFSNKPSIIMADKATVTMASGSKMILAQHPDKPPQDDDWPFDPPKAIGYWWSEEHTGLPHPTDFIHEDWEGPDRDAVLAHLRSGEVAHQWMGWSTCRLCSDDNGTVCLTDGVYVWPEGFAHYVEEHDVKPPKEFIAHVLNY